VRGLLGEEMSANDPAVEVSIESRSLAGTDDDPVDQSLASPAAPEVSRRTANPLHSGMTVVVCHAMNVISQFAKTRTFLKAMRCAPVYVC
jgi:hypothetical protein